jgi:glycosyltransferase involved in cell wall biosynthesis
LIAAVPRISVIIPTYKHRDFILAALHSVFAQTFSDYEIIVVNDGSPDDTAQLLKPRIDSGRIRYLEQPNAGQAAARNRGLRDARGEFIAFLDDDDLWPPHKLQWQFDAMRADPSLGAIAGIARQVDEQLRPFGMSPFFPEITFQSLFLGNPLLSPGQALIRADLLRDLGGFNEAIWGTDDWDLWFRIARQSRMQMRNECALTYRVHRGNASRNLKKMLANTVQVIDTHWPELQAPVARSLQRPVQRWIYNYLGSQMAEALRLVLSKGEIRNAITTVKDMRYFVRPALRDPRIVAMIARDMLPASLRHALGALTRKLGRRFRANQTSPSSRMPPA